MFSPVLVLSWNWRVETLAREKVCTLNRVFSLQRKKEWNSAHHLVQVSPSHTHAYSYTTAKRKDLFCNICIPETPFWLWFVLTSASLPPTSNDDILNFSIKWHTKLTKVFTRGIYQAILLQKNFHRTSRGDTRYDLNTVG